jgi:2-oxo-4-hydroxy-4-carboxy-5-ureidoimidazoline decarboxylase
MALSQTSLTLAVLNGMEQRDFSSALSSVFEHSPWVAERAFAARPFASVDHLHQTMMDVVRQVSREQQVALLRAHPELAGREAQEGTMTADSASEQGRLGFHALATDELARMTQLNRAYRDKFGFPCIIALRRHENRASVFAEHERRLANDAATEIGSCIEQVGVITRGRLDRLLAQPRSGL